MLSKKYVILCVQECWSHMLTDQIVTANDMYTYDSDICISKLPSVGVVPFHNFISND